MRKIIYVPEGNFSKDDVAKKRKNVFWDEAGRRIEVPKGKLADHTCRHCSGTGAMKCPRCDGTGTFTSKDTCYYCQGKRMVECNACGGTGTIKD